MIFSKKSNLRMIAVIALVVLLAAVGLSGCGANKADKDTRTTVEPTQGAVTTGATETVAEDPFKDPLEISVGMWDISEDNVSPEKDALAKEVLTKFNIKIKPVPTTWDDYQQKIQMWAAAGQLPDVFAIDMVDNKVIRNNWITQGVVRAVPTDLSKFPYLDGVMQLPDSVALKSEDGKFYCLPRNDISKSEYTAWNERILYRWDWAQKLGITKEPETYDEFVAMLKAFVEKDPEGKKTVGLTIHFKGLLNALFVAYNPSINNYVGKPYPWIKENGQFIPAYLSEKTLAGLTVMRNLYTQGLLDKDFPLLKGTEGDDKFLSGRAGAVITNTLDISTFVKNYPGKESSECVKILKMWPAADGGIYRCNTGTYWSESYFNTSVDDKKMERILYLYDYLLSPEGKDLYRWGIEGVDYKKEGDKFVDLDPKVDIGDKYKSKITIGMLASWDGDFSFDPNCPTAYPKDQVQKLEFIDWAKNNCKVGEINQEVSSLSTPLKDKFPIQFGTQFQDDVVNIVLSKKTVEEAWKETIKSYEGKGLNEMIAEVNAMAAEKGIQ